MALPRSNRPTRFAAVLGLLGATLLPGLAPGADETASSPPAAANEDEKALLERAEGYWGARVERSREVFDYYVPPEKGGPESVFENGGVVWREFEIQRVAVDGEKGVVTVKARTSLATQVPVNLPESLMNPTINESWVRVDGTWYKKEVKPGLSRHHGKSDPKEQRTAAEEGEAEGAAPPAPHAPAEPPAKASETGSE